MATYHEARQRGEILYLLQQWLKWSENISKRALHHQGIRRNPLIRGFIDSTREYAQELTSLQFYLAGPKKIHFLTEKDGKEAIASLRRAKVILAGGSWRIRKCVELLNRHVSHVHREKSSQVLSNPALKKSIVAEKVAIELEYEKFCKRTRTQFELRFEELKKEVVCMKRIVQNIDHSRVPSFLPQPKNDAPDSKSPSTFQRLLPWSNTQHKTRIYEMSGALPADSTPKMPKWARNLKTRLQDIQLDNALGTEPTITSLKIHYQVLKAREKLGIRSDPEASKDT
ncbi:hypothetical protein F5Y04DRAFT_287801 [Hypomontagnella monticulosa]|nr:hypothetical protein F5Y04DRAFT_287801 [Hypomontagnella monticulosa]